MDFTVLKAAGLTGNEAAYVFKVSRVTVMKWLRKDKPARPHPQIASRVDKMLQAIVAAHGAGDLPLQGAVDRVEVEPKVFVRPAVVKAIKKHLV